MSDNVVLQLPSNLRYYKFKASGSVCPVSYDPNVVLADLLIGHFLDAKYISSDILYLEVLASPSMC